jgi:hypothetical protein
MLKDGNVSIRWLKQFSLDSLTLPTLSQGLITLNMELVGLSEMSIFNQHFTEIQNITIM